MMFANLKTGHARDVASATCAQAVVACLADTLVRIAHAAQAHVDGGEPKQLTDPLAEDLHAALIHIGRSPSASSPHMSMSIGKPSARGVKSSTTCTFAKPRTGSV